MSDQKARRRPSFVVSPPAQTEFRVLSGLGGDKAAARAALDAAREQRLAAEARRAAARAARAKSHKP